ncbi:MAG: Gfo/Idh/MocA family oxidoreductase [Bacteroidetes Order II. Incertae sedis bacterium]|nr:Gfo/Idh/MocA family oxidoreductase [Bacteroidetes Order II. bacterium]
MRKLNRKIRYGMVGGGPGAFIGNVHKMAAALDGEIELVAGAFSSNPEKSRQRGVEWFLEADRVYGSYQEMAEKEANLPAGKRIDFVAIVTPNHTHYDIAKTFLEAGFHVMCDKPLVNTIVEAEDLVRLVQEKNLLFGLTHNYTGYPMVKQAREIVRMGKLGEIRKVVVEYPQGWLATLVEATGSKQAGWRTNPQQAGISSCIGDIGTHAENLAEYITGLKIKSLLADLTTFVEGRLLEDDANMLVRFENGAKGVLYASQVSVGEENNLRIRVYGTESGLEWHQEEPNKLWLKYPDRPAELMRRGNGYLGEQATHFSRIPAGHPEAFIEAFANLYRSFGRCIRARLEDKNPNPKDLDFPTVQDGLRGVNFIHKAVESGKTGQWVDL